MAKSNTLEQEILAFLFNGTAIPAPGASFHIALHSGDPTDAGDQTSNEVTTAEFDNYARVAVIRTAGGWAISGTTPTTVNPVAEIAFTAATGGTGVTATHFSVGELASGAGKIYYHGAITPPIVIADGVQPKLTTATNITED